MANLPEAGTWPAGIYQLETTDPVVGGPPDVSTGAGKSNIPLMQLAIRTALLKGTADRAFTTDNSPKFLSKNGHAQLGENGVILQWGEGLIQSTDTGGTLFTFSRSFPNACFVVVPADYSQDVNGGTGHRISVLRNSIGKNSFVAFAGEAGGSSLVTTYFSYAAIGW